MYLRAKDRPVSFLSTIRTLPKAPRPTTRSKRKWFRFTATREKAHGQHCTMKASIHFRIGGRQTFPVELDGLALTVAHCTRLWVSCCSRSCSGEWTVASATNRFFHSVLCWFAQNRRNPDMVGNRLSLSFWFRGPYLVVTKKLECCFSRSRAQVSWSGIVTLWFRRIERLI